MFQMSIQWVGSYVRIRHGCFWRLNLCALSLSFHLSFFSDFLCEVRRGALVRTLQEWPDGGYWAVWMVSGLNQAALELDVYVEFEEQ
jgi:hypothetical protein